ncbi:uncharacterized protein BXZ73DRAFT_102278 [Epithele typhae]|uniref:uncharacterized protein n=1 Tax=Epithele typhae TaxID=378194 RepID=UPI0020088C39|nr:uncharacterized protein BXZ73DRAFT_102278 [Epithele typhae]KAH9928437.1 hypothetical protein BXZ73DRAFT_102278 [Epithele typhae]
MKLEALALCALAALLRHVRAQVHTNATCSSDFDWMKNSKGQSPCLVTAWLWSPCFFPESFVPALAPDDLYGGPVSTAESDLCECNTVAFSTVAACGICQGRGDGVVPWSAYDKFCTETAAVSTYPYTVPSGTEIPAWAFQDVTESNVFNVTKAKAVAASDAAVPNSASTAPTSATSTSSGASTGTVLSNTSTAQTTNSSTSDASTGSPTPHRDTAAIIGGVLGGVLGVIIVGGLAAFVVRRRRRTGAAVRETDDVGTSTMHETHSPELKGDPAGLYRYNPDDPRTFPPELSV